MRQESTTIGTNACHTCNMEEVFQKIFQTKKNHKSIFHYMMKHLRKHIHTNAY